MRLRTGFAALAVVVSLCVVPFSARLAGQKKDPDRDRRGSRAAVAGRTIAGKPGNPVPAPRQDAPLPAQVLPDGSMIGTPTTGAPGITESVAQIMERDRQRASLPRTPRLSIEREMDLPPRKQRPGAIAAASWPLKSDGKTSDQKTERSERTIQPLAPQTVSTPNFTGATLADTLAFPPDTMGAVGPTQFIVAVNGRIRSFNKTTGAADGALNADTDVFFQSVLTPIGGGITSNFTSDPRIRYDRLSGRWFVIIIDVPNSGSVANRVLVAVSSGSTITSSSNFTFFFFSMDGTLFTDYPTLGIDNNALYIGANMFNLGGSFSNTHGAVVRKSSVLGAGPIVSTVFPNLLDGAFAGPLTPQGVDNYDPAATEGYFIGVDGANFSLLQVRRVTNAGTTPALSANIPIATPLTTGFPITVPHLGNTGGFSGNLDALDDRLFAAHIRNGRLWTAHNIEVDSTGASTTGGGRNGSRWYEIQNLNTGTPSIVQSGTVFDPAATNPLSYWIPSIMVSGQGHAALGFSAAGAAARINAATVGRLAGDTLGTTQGVPVLYTSSSTAYNPAGDAGGFGGRRWGDYSYTSLDPCDDMTMWTIQQFCDATNSYGVRAVRLLAPPPTITPCGAPTNVATGSSNVNVAITGTGFYDPPASVGTCRIPISASVSGTGVTVNSVTFNSATSVTVNISVSGSAPAGSRTITITNPDGQQAATATCLNITTPTLTLTQFYPVAATTGRTITITGTGFVPGNTQVFFGGTRLIPATVLSGGTSTQLQVTVPASTTGTGNINGFITVQVGATSVDTQGLAQNAANPGVGTATFPEFVLWGDYNGDGVFNGVDVTFSRAAFLGQIAAPTARQRLAVDVSPSNGNGSRGDGSFVGIDVTLLRALFLGQVIF